MFHDSRSSLPVALAVPEPCPVPAAPAFLGRAVAVAAPAAPTAPLAPLAPGGLVERLRAAGCVFAEEEAALLEESATGHQDLERRVRRRVAGEPLEVIVGWAEFCGLRIGVDPGVFVPRRRSEHLVDCALALAPAVPLVVDLCCGSGALGVAFASRAASAGIHAADIDPAAADCARRNLARHGGTATAGDLFSALPAELRGNVGLMFANVPYVPTGHVPLLPAEAREHEPLRALDGGRDGLAVLRRVAVEAGQWLAPGGVLLMETGAAQAEEVLGALTAGGLLARVRHDEERGATAVSGHRPGATPAPGEATPGRMG